jgi:hypothetical protein
MKVKIKYNNQREKNFNWRIKLNWEIALIKGKINQKNKGQIKKNKTRKTLIEWWNWNLKKLQQKDQRKKLKTKSIRIKTKNKTYDIL